MELRGIIKGLKEYKDGKYAAFLESKYSGVFNGILLWCKKTNKNKLVFLRGIIDYCYENGYTVTDLGSLYSLNARFFYNNVVYIIKDDCKLLDMWHKGGTINFYKNISINEEYSSILEEHLSTHKSILLICNSRGVCIEDVNRYIKFLSLVDNDLYIKYANRSTPKNDCRNKYYEGKLLDYVNSNDVNLSKWCTNNSIDYLGMQNFIKHSLGKINRELYNKYKMHKSRVYMDTLKSWVDTSNESLLDYLGSAYNTYRIFINTKLEGMDKGLYDRIKHKKGLN